VTQLNERVAVRPPAQNLDEILVVLRLTADCDMSADPAVHFTMLDHGLQTGAVLRSTHPDDRELAVAGLLHDIGHFLPPYRDEAHGDSGATFLRPVLGDVVADLVRLHVAAKRYLVTTESSYRDQLSWDSVASLAHQGGAMSAAEVEEFESEPLAARAVQLRKADEDGKIAGLDIGPLESWRPALVALATAGPA
jgi:predicted HD phosphohydrolase